MVLIMDAITLSRKGVEVWQPIPGFSNYVVSNLGMVKSLERRILRCDGVNRTIRERILKASPDAYGYPRVTLSIDGLPYYKKVAHLVYLAFVGVNNKPLLRHLDDNKLNSCLYNLAPGTHAENLADAVHNGTHKLGYGAKLHTNEVIDIRNSQCSYTVLADHYAVSVSTIAGIKKGRRWGNSKYRTSGTKVLTGV